MGERREDDHIDAIFCSDMQRSYKTAEIAFAGRNIPIFQDKRLRECDYGALTQHSKAEVDQEKARRVTEPFPGGESYEQTTARIKSFLDDLGGKYAGKRVMIIGHRATQYGLEHLLEGVPLAQTVTAPWKWQPGWTYHRNLFGTLTNK
ncbi:MAG: histidine phosphatase family protein [Patescibacteria group bacterium]|nr:histidine phosphatase family protein [Patescibacteria group bacterium]